MNITEKSTDDLLRRGETLHLECKTAQGGLPRSLWESYSAFCNTDGGQIILGVSEVDHKLTIQGVADSAALIKQFWDDVNNREKVSANILANGNVYALNRNDKQLVVIEVPRANRRVRPIYIGKDVFEGSYRRNGEGDYKCSRDTVMTMLRDSCEKTADTAVVESLTLDDLNEESIRRYRMRFEHHKPDHSWNGLSTDKFLKNIGAARKDDSGVMRPTVAGLVCFGNFVDIIATLPNYFVDYRERNTDETRWSDRVCAQDGTWSGNIIDFNIRISDRLTADIKKPFAIANDNISRIEDTDVHKAVREVLANALIHADYYGRRGIVIEKRFRHLTFANPGAMLMSKEDAVSGGNTEPRNTGIFNIFALVEIGERSGMGLSNLLEVCKKYGFYAPQIKETFDPDRTIVELEVAEVTTASTISQESDKPLQELDKKLTEGLQELDKNLTINSLDISSTAKRVYKALSQDGTFTQQGLANKFGVSRVTIANATATLIKSGLIRRVGPTKGGHWEVIK